MEHFQLCVLHGRAAASAQGARAQAGNAAQHVWSRPGVCMGKNACPSSAHLAQQRPRARSLPPPLPPLPPLPA